MFAIFTAAASGLSFGTANGLLIEAANGLIVHVIQLLF